MPLILLGISGGMFKLATAGLKRVCIGLDRVIDDAGAEVIDVQHMTLRGSGTRRYAREDCEGSRDTRVSQNFAVLDTRRGGPAVYYLFPVGGWWSDDLPYLKTFLYEKFFRVEKPPPPDEALIAIEGFGPFRPAALADPEHAAARRLPWPVAPAALTVRAAGWDSSVCGASAAPRTPAGHAVLCEGGPRVRRVPHTRPPQRGRRQNTGVGREGVPGPVRTCALPRGCRGARAAPPPTETWRQPGLGGRAAPFPTASRGEAPVTTARPRAQRQPGRLPSPRRRQ